jgi:hypothetical protein
VVSGPVAADVAELVVSTGALLEEPEVREGENGRYGARSSVAARSSDETLPARGVAGDAGVDTVGATAFSGVTVSCDDDGIAAAAAAAALETPGIRAATGSAGDVVRGEMVSAGDASFGVVRAVSSTVSATVADGST